MNGQETEVKFFVQDMQRIEVRLRELKAHLIQARVHEINHRFDDANGDLRKSSKILRLRQDTEAKFTFKGPSREDKKGVHTRMELEFSVGDFDSAKKFLEALGYRSIVFYEKFRTTYELNNTHIMLDEMPYGNFIEIEGADIDVIFQIAALLGLNWDAMVKAGYHSLFERIAGKYKLDPNELSFNALKNIHPTEADFGFAYADK